MKTTVRNRLTAKNKGKPVPLTPIPSISVDSKPLFCNHADITTRLLLSACAKAAHHKLPVHKKIYPKAAPSSNRGINPKNWK